MDECHKLLVTGLEALKLTLPENQIEQLLNFIKLIEKWNKAYNLTAIRSRQDMIRLHLLDSLAVLSYIKGHKVIDIGTGAGLPGIPLAIALPQTEFTLLDSNAKKTRFVQQAVLELKLKNVTICHQRVEKFHPETAFNEIITRAFTNLSDMVQLTSHLLNKEGVLFAMKGKMQESEIALLSSQYLVNQIPIRVPGIDAERCLIKIKSLAQAEVP
jgi:16S rRNA (guanine527-N7)-methyltransferase